MNSDEVKRPDPSIPPEPSVLDYVKSLLRFPGTERIQLQESVEETQNFKPAEAVTVASETFPVSSTEEKLQPFQPPPAWQAAPRAAPWRSLLALLVALAAQATFEPPGVSAYLGIALYVASFSLLGWAIYRAEWTLAPVSPTSTHTDPLTYRGRWLIVSVVLAFAGFLLFGDNLFTRFNVAIWIFAILFWLGAFWLYKDSPLASFRNFVPTLQRDSWTINISRWTLLLAAATLVVFFFRFHQITGVPSDPISDHAEKILDVYDISHGQTRIFFIRNTGREAFQMYWTLLVAQVFNTGLSFLSLKLGTAILGFLTLPFVYLLGKELGGARVGLFALLLVGIAYWPNVISRFGLRFPLYPLFAASTLFFLLRGLRTRNRNDFLLAGIFLGVGLHGYSPFRIMPFVVVAAFVLFWLHAQSQGARKQLPVWLALVGSTALLVFLPLLRYWMDYPEAFSSRALSRLTGAEQALPGNPLVIFLSNIWNALKMFNFDDGEIWVISVTQRPALDVVSGALFLLGAVLVLIRYLRNRHWLDLFLLVSVPLLAMPSILSLAFPNENPALNRAGAAYIPVLILAAIALDGLVTSLRQGKSRGILAGVLAAILLCFSAAQNYDLVFRQYHTSFRNAAWNTSDIGKAIREFELIYDRTDTAWVVPFPHWVDTRLTAIWAGTPNRDMAMWREDLEESLAFDGPKLFVVKADLENPDGNDQASLDVLQSLYPSGQLRMFDSDVPGRDFWIFLVPP